MRLSDVLSRPPQYQFVQVDGFLVNKKGDTGQKVDLPSGTVALNYYCEDCNDLRTFFAKGTLSCIFVNKRLISIDCVLSCGCGATVQVWFLVESKDDITSTVPEIRILKRAEKLSNNVSLNMSRYREYTELLDKAERAYRDELGAGAIVYLRKIFEIVTMNAAIERGINTRTVKGKRRPFKEVLDEVESTCHIIPEEFSSNGYMLFGELSDVIHGEFDEELGLKKYEPLHRLVTGILENIQNKQEYKQAMKMLEWPKGEV